MKTIKFSAYLNKVIGSNPSNFKGAHRPVEKVSWSDEVEYCRRLTAKQRGEGILPEVLEWRLPTEAEWEYAARAGIRGLAMVY
jgi:formylglycine-generating enzyme required for sulfatase activity